MGYCQSNPGRSCLPELPVIHELGHALLPKLKVLIMVENLFSASERLRIFNWLFWQPQISFLISSKGYLPKDPECSEFS